MVQTRKRTRLQTSAATAAVPPTSPTDDEASLHTNVAGEYQRPIATSDDNDEKEDGDEDGSDDEEDDDEDEVVLSEQFDGPTDDAGKPHGRGTLTVHFQRGKRRGRNVFTGSFAHGFKLARYNTQR